MEIQRVHREEMGYPACFNDLSKRPSPPVKRKICVIVSGRNAQALFFMQQDGSVLKRSKNTSIILIDGCILIY